MASVLLFVLEIQVMLSGYFLTLDYYFQSVYYITHGLFPKL